MSLIRDAEIENIIREYATPVFEAAGLHAKDIKLYLVNDDSINAFVAGGQKLFINTGLLLKSDHPGQVIGVIAHETGHIAGGHLARQQEELSNASAASILATILGGAAILASGRADVGAAVLQGGHGAVVRSFLHYSRSHESSADQAALTYLDKTHQSSKGLYEFMKKLEDQELLTVTSQDPYMRTHPFSRDRVTAMERHLKDSKFTDQPDPPRLVALHARMKAKLIGYLKPGLTFRIYKSSDKSLPARYARAIAYFRRGDAKRALPLIEQLIAEHPDDPYFQEVRGQGMYETGNAVEALKSYTMAVKLLPDSDLMRKELAEVQLAVEDPALLDNAIENLEYAAKVERFSASTYQDLGTAYFRKGDDGRARLNLADAAFLRGQADKAIYHAERAARTFTNGSREWLRAQDIINAARIQKDKAHEQ